MGDRQFSASWVMGESAFIRKVLIVLGIVLLALLLWELANVLLLAFGAVLVAIILRASAGLFERYLRVPPRWSLAAASLVILTAFVGLLVLFGTQIRAQLASVIEQLPFAIDAFSKNIGLGAITDELGAMVDGLPAGGLAARLAGIGGTILGGLADALLVVVAGLYIAASPRTYIEGFVKLFPMDHHRRVKSSLTASGEALKLWLVAQLIAMTCVGILSALAFWLIGLPSPYALGLIAGMADFIPFLGPILGALPAVMIALTLSGEAALWTIFAVFAIQQIEGSVIFPLAARRAVSIPPALALFAIVAGSLIFGPLGLIFGFPLGVVSYVLVKKLYVRETLGEHTTIPGEPAETRESAGP